MTSVDAHAARGPNRKPNLAPRRFGADQPAPRPLANRQPDDDASPVGGPPKARPGLAKPKSASRRPSWLRNASGRATSIKLAGQADAVADFVDLPDLSTLLKLAAKPPVWPAPPNEDGARKRKRQSVLAQLAALKTMSALDLKAKWRALFDREPPPYNRRYLESRLAYRIQELAFGGLKPETVARLNAIADEKEGKGGRRRSDTHRPIAGTQLIREWQGVEHRVTVRAQDYEYQGRPYRSLSAIARAIAGTRWNGLVFFGLKNQRRA